MLRRGGLVLLAPGHEIDIVKRLFETKRDWQKAPLSEAAISMLLNPMPKYTMFGFDSDDYSSAKVVVLPVPYDHATTYKAGSRDGPHAIIEASRSIEPYSYELGRKLEDKSVYTLDELQPDLDSLEKMQDRVSGEVAMIIDDGKIPLMLGGDHSLTIGAIKAFKKRGRDISIIHLDAHADSWEELFGSKYTHGSVITRAGEMYENIVQVGIRCIDEESAKKHRDRILFAEDFGKMGAEKAAEWIIKNTGKDVYITIDIDVLDPSEMPSVGTPEPAGLFFRDLVSIMKSLSKEKNLAGMDIMELAPIPGIVAPNFLAAKLAYLSLGFFLK